MAILRTLLASLILLVAGIGVLVAATNGFRAYTTETARRINVREHPSVIPPLLLQNASGEHISFDELRGRWLLIDFIYTRCKTYCSVQGGVFARLQQQLSEPIAAGKVVLLSISFDPVHDNPDALTNYQRIQSAHGAGWIAARPLNDAELATLMQAFGVIVVPDGLGRFVHNAAIAVVNPDGKLVAILDWDDSSSAARYVSKQLVP